MVNIDLLSLPKNRKHDYGNYGNAILSMILNVM